MKHIASIDSAEWRLAAAQLNEIELANSGKAWTEWKDAVIAWHLEEEAIARAEAWIPGLARLTDPAVEAALSGSYRHQMRVTIERLESDRLELRCMLLDAIACLRFYATGASDAGERAHSVLHSHENLCRRPSFAIVSKVQN